MPVFNSVSHLYVLAYASFATSLTKYFFVQVRDLVQKFQCSTQFFTYMFLLRHLLPQVWPDTFCAQVRDLVSECQCSTKFLIYMASFATILTRNFLCSRYATWCRNANVQLSFSHTVYVLAKASFATSLTRNFLCPGAGPGVGVPVFNQLKASFATRLTRYFLCSRYATWCRSVSVRPSSQWSGCRRASTASETPRSSSLSG